MEQEYFYAVLGQPILYFEAELPSEDFDLGTTYEDYLEGKWVLLNEECSNFYKEHLNATPEEVFNFTLPAFTVEEEAVEEAKVKKIKELLEYDSSDAVNEFELNGDKVWLDKATRVGLVNSITIEKASGAELVTIWFESSKLELTPDDALDILKDLELYAVECFNTTAQHKATINSLSSIDGVEAYDFTTNYPNKLKFTI